MMNVLNKIRELDRMTAISIGAVVVGCTTLGLAIWHYQQLRASGAIQRGLRVEQVVCTTTVPPPFNLFCLL